MTLKKTGGGVFEITVDGRLTWSKKGSGSFPNDAQVLAAIGQS